MVRGVVETGRAAWQDAVDRWGAMGRIQRITSCLLAFMIVARDPARPGIGYPPRNTFDELPTAQHMLLGVPDLQDYHPRWASSWARLGFSSRLQLGGTAVHVSVFRPADRHRRLLVRARFSPAGGRLGWRQPSWQQTVFSLPIRARLHRHHARLLHHVERPGGARGAHLRGMAVAGILIGIATSIKWSAAQSSGAGHLDRAALSAWPWYTIFWFGLSPIVHFSSGCLAAPDGTRQRPYGRRERHFLVDAQPARPGTV